MLVSSWHFPLITKSSFITTFFGGYSIEIVGFSVSTASPKPTSQAEKTTARKARKDTNAILRKLNFIHMFPTK